MNDSDLSCGGGGYCPYSVVIACNCVNPPVMLCDGCISNHVLGSGDHHLLHLSHPHHVSNSSNVSGPHEESSINEHKIKTSMIAYIDTLKEFKTKLTAFKVDLLGQIEKTFDAKLEQIDFMLDHTYIQS